MIYVSSRVHHAAMWRDLRSMFPIRASWLDAGVDPDLRRLWRIAAEEAAGALSLILYAVDGDLPLRGALVEVGAALGAGVPVYVVAGDLPVGDWTNHPRVSRCETVVEALLRGREKAGLR